MRRRTIKPGVIESVVRSIAAGLAKPGVQGPNFTWAETFPRFASQRVIFALGAFKLHKHHLEEIDRCVHQVASEYQALAHKPAPDE